MDPVDFIGHLLAHVPEPYENAPKYFGGYSNHFPLLLMLLLVASRSTTVCGRREYGKNPNAETTVIETTKENSH